MPGPLGDLRHPFFRPAWRRWAIVVLCLSWGAFELWLGEMLWGALFVGVGTYAAWEFHRVWSD